jgi:histidinol-phosphate aminotransferase
MSAPRAKTARTKKYRLPVRRAILERQTYEAPAEGRRGKVRLDFNENTSGCSPAVLRALRGLSGKELAMYPEYVLRTARIARRLGVRPEELLLANGGDDALRVFFDTFVEDGGSVLICEPTFPMYRYYAEIAGAKIATARYDAEMRFPLREVLTSLKKRPRVLFIANPNNPTGTLVSRSAIRAILQAATHTAVVMDEAYAEFSGFTVLPWIRTHRNLFVVRTFSKAAGLAALRLGAVMACAESLQLLRRAMPPYPVNVMALVAAEAALVDGATVTKYVRETVRRRKIFSAALMELGVRVYPSAGNFVLADFGARGSKFFAQLGRAGILVRERSKEIAPGFVRISIGTQAEMSRVVKQAREFANRAGSGRFF